jgi:rhodanese-related sulfurtransferase
MKGCHMTVKSAVGLVTQAREQIENLSVEQVAKEVEAGAILVDVRDGEERDRAGAIPGAVHASRGMLEFYADPSLPYHKSELDPDRRIILHCASGGRSALAALTLRQMGYQDVAHLDGGFNAWKDAGLPVEGGAS